MISSKLQGIERLPQLLFPSRGADGDRGSILPPAPARRDRVHPGRRPTRCGLAPPRSMVGKLLGAEQYSTTRDTNSPKSPQPRLECRRPSLESPRKSKAHVGRIASGAFSVHGWEPSHEAKLTMARANCSFSVAGPGRVRGAHVVNMMKLWSLEDRWRR